MHLPGHMDVTSTRPGCPLSADHPRENHCESLRRLFRVPTVQAGEPGRSYSIVEHRM